MTDKNGWPLGHEPLETPVNYRNELRRLRSDPLEPLIRKVGGVRRFAHVFQDTISRYEETFECYFLSLSRFLPAQSLAARWLEGPYFKLKHRRRYTETERKLALRFNKVAPFLYLDFYNCLLWGRILLDRTISLARYFLSGNDLPSFYSFADHKKFFRKRTTEWGDQEEYARYIREQTDWFDMPLKHVRDLFVVHSSPRHIRVFGHPWPTKELNMILHRTPTTLEEPPVIFSVTRMAREIHQFQRWFAEYGCRLLSRRN